MRLASKAACSASEGTSCRKVEILDWHAFSASDENFTNSALCAGEIVRPGMLSKYLL